MPMINMNDYPRPCSRRNPHTRHGWQPSLFDLEAS
jgi:hypothetical protein